MNRVSVHSVLFWLCVVATAGCRQEIVHNLEEQEANRLLAKLHSSSLSPTKDQQADGKWSIAVDQADIPRAVTLLDDLKLLTTTPTSEEKPSNSLFASNEEIRLTYERRKAADIARTLEGLAQVLQAKVHLNLPATNAFGGGRAQETNSASVLLVVTSGFKITTEEIAGLVGGSTGIPHDRVQVLLNVEQPSDVASDLGGQESATIGANTGGGNQIGKVSEPGSKVQTSRTSAARLTLVLLLLLATIVTVWLFLKRSARAKHRPLSLRDAEVVIEA